MAWGRWGPDPPLGAGECEAEMAVGTVIKIDWMCKMGLVRTSSIFETKTCIVKQVL